MKIKVGVIFGGNSVEHEVSIISAVQAMESIDCEKYEVIPIYITKQGIWYTGGMLKNIDVYKDFEDLKRYAKRVAMVKHKDGIYLQTTGLFRRMVTDIDVVLPIVHGQNVEDGTIQGYLEMLNIPYVGSGVLGSALGQDKVIMKQIFDNANIPFVPYIWFYDSDYYNNIKDKKEQIKKLGYPVIVKPASLGSSIGINIVKDENELEDAVEDAISYDKKIIVEKLITNLMEVNCSVMGNYEHQQISEIEEVLSTDEFLTYYDKYMGKSKTKGLASATRIIPARINEKVREQIENLSKEVFKVLNLSGICRIDYLIDRKKEKIYVNEPNTIPGSLAFYLWEPKGKSYSLLLDEIISIAIKDFKAKKSKNCHFDTNILSNYGVKGIKGIKK